MPRRQVIDIAQENMPHSFIGRSRQCCIDDGVAKSLKLLVLVRSDCDFRCVKGGRNEGRVIRKFVRREIFKLRLDFFHRFGQLVEPFRTPSFERRGELSNHLTTDEHRVIDQWAAHQNRLVTHGADGAANKHNIVTWLQEKNMPITAANLSLALSNIVNSGHLGHAPLVWKRVEQKRDSCNNRDEEYENCIDMRPGRWEYSFLRRPGRNRDYETDSIQHADKRERDSVDIVFRS
jgi:hypothetical protein